MKVGKAIYNILSRSTEVQSNFPFNTTDYSPTGTELVTNGDFATDGTPTTSSWSLGWAIVGADGGGANITGGELVLSLPDGEDSNYNRIYATNGSSAITGVVEVGKSYKLTYTVTAVSGSTTFKYIRGGSYADAPASLGTHVIHYDCTVTGHFGFRNSGNDSSITLDNVSIEEMVLNKIFPELAPPDIDAPYIVYSVVSNSPSDTKNANGDIDTASIEVYGFQDTYNRAVDLGVSVRAALDRKTGTYNTIEIQSTNYVNEQMDVNEARKLWAAIQDYSIRIKNL